MAVEKEVSENIIDETKVEEIQEQPEGLPPVVEVEGEEVVEENLEDDFNANLAEEMDERDLKRLGLELIEEYKKDRESRKEWEEGYTKGLDLLGVKYREQTRPFKGASGVTHPLLSESATTFQASAYKELLPADGPVRTQVIGLRTPATEHNETNIIISKVKLEGS